MFVDFDARSLLRLAPVIEAIEIDAPRLRLARLSPGRYDIDDLLQRFSQPSDHPSAEPARFALFNLRLAGGEITLDDRPVGRRHEMRKIRLDLPFLSNLPDDLLVKVEPRLAFVLEWQRVRQPRPIDAICARPSLGLQDPLRQARPEPLWAYLPEALPVQPAGGALSADLNLRFEQPAAGRAARRAEGQIDLRDLALKAPAMRRCWPGKACASGLPTCARCSARCRSTRCTWTARCCMCGAMPRAAWNSSAWLRRVGKAARARGEPAGHSSRGGATRPRPAGKLQLALLELNGAQLHWLDATVQPSAELQLEGIDLRLKQLRWPVEADATLSLDARLSAAGKASGQLHAEGTLTDRQAKVCAAGQRHRSGRCRTLPARAPASRKPARA